MQIVQLIGAALILMAFALIQTGRLRPDRLLPIGLNFVGAILLATSALADEQWGFLILNTAWTLIAGWGLVRKALVVTEARR